MLSPERTSEGNTGRTEELSELTAAQGSTRNEEGTFGTIFPPISSPGREDSSNQ